MKFLGMTNVLRNTAVVACLALILSSCSGTRYGYISRVKDNKVEKTTATNESEAIVAEENNSNNQVDEASLNNFAAEEGNQPAIVDEQTRKLNNCKTQNEVQAERAIKKVKGVASLKEMKRVKAAVKADPDSNNSVKEISGYFRTGLILVLIGAILLFFPPPVSVIGYIVMLVGVVFVVLGLIDML